MPEPIVTMVTADSGRGRSGRRWSLAARLTAWYACTAFILVAGTGLLQYRTLDADLAVEDDRLVRETLAAAQRGSLAAMPGTVSGAPTERDAEIGPIVRELDAGCRVRRGVWPSSAPPSRCRTDVSNAGVRLWSWRSPAGRVWRMASGPMSGPMSGPAHDGGSVEVALDRWTDESVLADYREKLSVTLAVALLLSVATGFVFARRGLAPLVGVARRVGAIDARSLEQRLEPVPDAPAEVAALVDSCNAMLARLEGAFAALTHFSAELAHDFRTPLHVMRGQTEVTLARARTPEAYREVLASNLEEIERLGRLVDDALFLARAEDPRATITRVRTDVGAELAQVAEFLEPLATDVAVSLTTHVAPGLTFVVDRMLFRRALVNLITNAIRHSNADGRVALTARAAGNVVEVDVADAGEGMPPETVVRASERYYRAPGSAARGDGVGLGLAIVHGVMQLHGGEVRTVSRVGGGTCVTLVFPSTEQMLEPVSVEAPDR